MRQSVDRIATVTTMRYMRKMRLFVTSGKTYKQPCLKGATLGSATFRRHVADMAINICTEPANGRTISTCPRENCPGQACEPADAWLNWNKHFCTVQYSQTHSSGIPNSSQQLRTQTRAL